MKRVDSPHSTWLFDEERMRYRRLPKGADVNAPTPERDWEPYFALDFEDDGSFTVALNDDRTRLLRSWSEDAATAPEPTTELHLEVVEPGPEA